MGMGKSNGNGGRYVVSPGKSGNGAEVGSGDPEGRAEVSRPATGHHSTTE